MKTEKKWPSFSLLYDVCVESRFCVFFDTVFCLILFFYSSRITSVPKNEAFATLMSHDSMALFS